jgi:hypothetical protein
VVGADGLDGSRISSPGRLACRVLRARDPRRRPTDTCRCPHRWHRGNVLRGRPRGRYRRGLGPRRADRRQVRLEISLEGDVGGDGPSEDCCPEKIVGLLTPTANEYALAWRERCRARLARVASVRPGRAVEFSTDYLTPEGPCRSFVAVDPAHGTFRSGSGVTYRIKTWKTESFELLGSHPIGLRAPVAISEKGEMV